MHFDPKDKVMLEFAIMFSLMLIVSRDAEFILTQNIRPNFSFKAKLI